MQKARRHTKKGAPTACRRTVSGSISLLYLRCFSPFPHGTGSLSVSRIYLALPDGPGGFTQDFTCPALLRIHLTLHQLTNTQLSCSMVGLSRPFFFVGVLYSGVLLPHACRNKGGLGCSLFARHYWGNHCCFLFLRLLRCFSSPRMPQHYADTWSSTKWVVPFGNLGINGYLHLNRAYRSLSRPSSPPRA